jgi:hypothetical protein
MIRALPFLLAGLAPVVWADLPSIKVLPDPLVRFERALLHAEAKLKQARDIATTGGVLARLDEALSEHADACELSIQALRDTGKRPGKLGKYYKKGELRLRDFVRRLDDLSKNLNLDDRPIAERALKRIQVVQEEYLVGVMSK